MMYLLAAIGLTFIVTDSKICRELRESVSKKIKVNKFYKAIDSVINCPQCMGFWAGVVFAIPSGLYVLPFASSGVCYLFSKIILYLNRH